MSGSWLGQTPRTLAVITAAARCLNPAIPSFLGTRGNLFAVTSRPTRLWSVLWRTFSRDERGVRVFYLWLAALGLSLRRPGRRSAPRRLPLARVVYSNARNQKHP